METIIAGYILIEFISGCLLLILAATGSYKPKMDRFYWIQFAVLAAAAAASAISKGIQAKKQRKLAGQIHPDDPTYVESPYAASNLGLASSLFNGRMAGATDAEQNIFASQGNTLGAINRNAGSGSQALALAAGTQGQTNESLRGLQVAEQQNKYGLASQLYAANNNMTNERNKVYQDKIRKYGNDVQAKTALQQAAANNVSGIYSDLATIGMSAAGAANAGAFTGTSPFGNGMPTQQTNGLVMGSQPYMGTAPYPWMQQPNTGMIGAAPSNLTPLQWNAVTGKWVRY